MLKDVPSALMRQTLLDRELVRPIDRPVIRMLPWLNVVALGGRSIIDRGAEALGPLVEELRTLVTAGEHKMLILTGPGVRARHVLGVGLDLGLPTGALAALASTEAEQNGHLVAALLAEHGVSYLPHSMVARQLAVHLAASPAVVSNGYPPYGLYEFPPQLGKIPPHQADVGAFLLADAFGAARTIFVKDVDGVLVDGRPVDRASTAELAGRELPIDPLVLPLMSRAKHVKRVQVINGRKPGNLTKALNDEPVGTVVEAS